MISLSSRGKGFDKTIHKLTRLNQRIGKLTFLDKYGQQGVSALSSATPRDTGASADGWYYTITTDKNGPRIEWHNKNVVDGLPVVILIQYGHGTGTGGYVEGIDFINPAIRPVFEDIKNNILKEVRGGY